MPIFQWDFFPYSYNDCVEQGISLFSLEVFGNVHNFFFFLLVTTIKELESFSFKNVFFLFPRVFWLLLFLLLCHMQAAL